MKTSIVLTILADDEPGLVQSVARVISDHDGSWLESNMSHLAGKFAGILRVEIETDRAEKLVRGLEGLGSSGITVNLSESATSTEDTGHRPMTVELVGQDRPGIVHAISVVFAAHSINVDSLETETMAAPMSGEKLFKATANLRVPDSVDLESVQSRLEEIAADLMVELDFPRSGGSG